MWGSEKNGWKFKIEGDHAQTRAPYRLVKNQIKYHLLSSPPINLGAD